MMVFGKSDTFQVHKCNTHLKFSICLSFILELFWRRSLSTSAEWDYPEKRAVMHVEQVQGDILEVGILVSNPGHQRMHLQPKFAAFKQ